MIILAARVAVQSCSKAAPGLRHVVQVFDHVSQFFKEPKSEVANLSLAPKIVA